MNVEEAYEMANAVLTQFAGQEPISMPDLGTNREKVEHLLEEYARRLKKEFWRYRIYKNNRNIPEMMCQYLGKMLTEDDEKAEQ
jgi:hypothetical protein